MATELFSRIRQLARTVTGRGANSGTGKSDGSTRPRSPTERSGRASGGQEPQAEPKITLESLKAADGLFGSTLPRGSKVTPGYGTHEGKISRGAAKHPRGLNLRPEVKTAETAVPVSGAIIINVTKPGANRNASQRTPTPTREREVSQPRSELDQRKRIRSRSGRGL